MIDWDFLASDKFMAYGLILFYFVIPLCIVIFFYIIRFIFEYSEFRDWKRQQKLDFQEKEKD